MSGTIFVDATDLGDLLPACGVSWFIGAEAKSDTEEPHAEPHASPGHIQPITVSIAVEHRPDGENHIDRAAGELLAGADRRAGISASTTSATG